MSPPPHKLRGLSAFRQVGTPHHLPAGSWGENHARKVSCFRANRQPISTKSGGGAPVAIALFPTGRLHANMPNTPVLFVALFVLTVLAAPFSRGQSSPPGASLPDLTFNRYYETLVIPFSKEVALELNLNEAQRIQAKKLALAQKKDPTFKERAKFKYDTFKLLTEDQRARFEQLTLQYQGALASFNLPEIATKLGLTAEQKQRLDSIQFLLRTGSQNLNAYEKNLYPQGPQRGRFLLQLRRSCDCVAESVLVPAQMLKWRDLQGKPMDPRPADWN